jgi:hypothetical protein
VVVVLFDELENVELVLEEYEWVVLLLLRLLLLVTT